jgi:hypothetical protein
MMRLNLSKAIVIPNSFRDNKLPPPVILERSHRKVKQVQDDEVLNYFVSRRGAEEAERAEWCISSRAELSAASALSAPLRETNNTPFGAGGAA